MIIRGRVMKRSRLFILCALTVSHAALADLIDNGDGTVTDTSTGLMWLQNPKQAGAPMSWTDALAWADDLDFAGHTDWRLPGAGFLPSGAFCVEGGTLSNGGCNQGYYISRPGAQLATLYLNTLGNQPYCSFDYLITEGNWPVCGESDRNANWTNPSIGGPFVDVNGRFWLNQGIVGFLAMYFDMVTGVQGADTPSQPAAYPWAIRGERPRADLSITMTDGVTSLDSGDSVTYTIVIANAGPDAAPNTVFRDMMQGGVVLVDNITWTCIGSGGVTCPASGVYFPLQIMDLPVGGTLTYTVTATVTAEETGSVTNTATVTPSPDIEDPDPANNTATDMNTVSGAPTPAPGARAIPTLSEWGLIILAGVTALLGIARSRRRSSSPL